MKQVKVAHMSDLHFSGKHLAEATRVFDSAIAGAIEEKAEVAVISGDSSDEPLTAHSPAYRELAKQLQRLANAMPVLMLQGTFSHEAPGMLESLSRLATRYSIYAACSIEQVALTQGNEWAVVSEGRLDGSQKAVFSLLPSINKARTFCGDYAEHLLNTLEGFAPCNARAAALGIPTILVSHGVVKGCITEHERVMNGSDHEYGIGDLFSAGANATMLGHIHLHQAWDCDYQVAAYAGSLPRLHFGEAGEKGWLLWNVAQGTTSFESKPSPRREMLELSIDGVPNLEELAAFAASNPGADVKLRFSVDEEFKESVNLAQIRELFKGCELKVERVVNPAQRSRASGISGERNTRELLRLWAEQSNINPEPLLKELDLLETHEA